MLSILMPCDFEGKRIDIDEPTTVKRLLERLSLNPESFLVLVNGRLATEEEVVKNSDIVKIVKVVSGG
ncbi:MAG: MoaD/ThiS family protein [Desulfobacterota bacterium]|nr:MoaD/ThiS family protein [Thermodesulfobacteriota bacterium]MDW8001961.1 MoaD/ThiS family protein [Deltaproteobacteria bacterium]